MQHLAFARSHKQSSGKYLATLDAPNNPGLYEHGQRPIKLYLDTTSCKQPSNAKDRSSPVQERASFLLCCSFKVLARLPYVCSNWVYRFQTSTDFSGGSEFKALSIKHGHSYHHLNCRRNLHIRECIQAHA
ncbi:hypothetical protein MKW98_019542 [Papaver atlanticum]|uniref:Uncharacterized protein n=1 Tax=Papaver atlanticum TaxID=357466 RepID=A0AAD4XA69_9MAGN|nr:hypothetical protein MKW98_019542 [Papaver atlanticum]